MPRLLQAAGGQQRASSTASCFMTHPTLSRLLPSEPIYAAAAHPLAIVVDAAGHIFAPVTPTAAGDDSEVIVARATLPQAQAIAGECGLVGR